MPQKNELLEGARLIYFRAPHKKLNFTILNAETYLPNFHRKKFSSELARIA